jgi:hypothetical protein
MRRYLFIIAALLQAGFAWSQNQNATQDVCQGATENYYVDNTPGSSYSWSIVPASGGTILSGNGTNSISIQWTNTPGTYTVEVIETDANNCVGPARNVSVTVREYPNPVIVGPSTACTNTQGNYSITGSLTSTYAWSVTPQGTVSSGGNTNTATIDWNVAGAATVSVTENNGFCQTTATYAVTVNPSPAPSISGPSVTCLNSTDVFEVTNNAGSTYVWSVSAGATIFAGQGTNQVSVTFNQINAQSVSIQETANGCTGSDTKNVTVNPLPNTSAIWHN